MATLRGYLTIDELESYAGIIVNDVPTAEIEIDLAEELIDSYIGAQQKAMPARYRGQVTAASNNDTTPYYQDINNTILQDNISQWSISDTSQFSQIYFLCGYLQYCVVEMVSGKNKGMKRRIVNNNYNARTIFLAEAFPNLCQPGDIYVIYQLSKIPRNWKDEEILSNVIYRYIPEMLKRAVAAQVEYHIEKGKAYQMGPTDLDNESILGYRAQVKQGGRNRMLAPKAREYLKGIRNVTGILDV